MNENIININTELDKLQKGQLFEINGDVVIIIAGCYNNESRNILKAVNLRTGLAYSQGFTEKVATISSVIDYFSNCIYLGYRTITIS